jgi:hypothetical protein
MATRRAFIGAAVAVVGLRFPAPKLTEQTLCGYPLRWIDDDGTEPTAVWMPRYVRTIKNLSDEATGS